MPPSPDLDRARYALSDRLVKEDVEAATHGAASISDAGLREAALSGAYGVWESMDPRAAAAWTQSQVAK